MESRTLGDASASRRVSASGATGVASKRETTLAFRKAEDLLEQLKMPFWHPGTAAVEIYMLNHCE